MCSLGVNGGMQQCSEGEMEGKRDRERNRILLLEDGWVNG